MPVCYLQTNVSLDESARTNFLTTLSQLVASELNKPESYVMVRAEFEATMTFAGSSEPCVYCELSSLGLESIIHSTLAKTFSEFLAQNLGLDLNRIYIRFEAPPRTHFAWNGKLFS